MRKAGSKLLIFFALITFISACKASANYNAEQSWATGMVFDVPESVLYNPAKKELYVSNINGQPLGRDGNGYISRLGLDGEIIIRKWVTGLDAPKGMGIFKNILYVADINKASRS